MTLKVITLHKSNHRQAAPTLRKIADEIEAGEYGKVGSIAVALLGDRLEVFAAGPDADGTAVACLLQAGAKVFLLTKGGVATTGNWTGAYGEFFIAWCPMPKRNKQRERELGLSPTNPCTSTGD